MPFKVKAFFIVLIILLFPALSRAAAYWLLINGNHQVNGKITVSLYYGSMDDYGRRVPDTGKELKLTGDFQLWLENQEGELTPLPLSLQKDCWQATFVPKHNGLFRIIGINDTHAVVDRSAIGGINVKPVDYICTDYNVGANISADFPQSPTQRLDILVKPEGKLLVVKAFIDKAPCKAGTTLRVFNPDNWEKELTLDINGEAKLYPTIKGLYIIRLDYTEPGSGAYQQINYSNTRHRCNYFFCNY